MKRVAMTKTGPDDLTEVQKTQLDALEQREPDTQDVPEAPETHWAYAQRFYRPRKEAISIRIDADVLHWLRQRGDRYQSEINRILRAAMESEGKS